MADQPKLTAEEQKWRGRDAARTLADAERIKNDPVLSKLAAREAKVMAKESMESANAMKKVADKVAPKAAKTAPKPTKPASKPKAASKPAGRKK